MKEYRWISHTLSDRHVQHIFFLNFFFQKWDQFYLQCLWLLSFSMKYVIVFTFWRAPVFWLKVSQVNGFVLPNCDNKKIRQITTTIHWIDTQAWAMRLKLKIMFQIALADGYCTGLFIRSAQNGWNDFYKSELCAFMINNNNRRTNDWKPIKNIKI